MSLPRPIVVAALVSLAALAACAGRQPADVARTDSKVAAATWTAQSTSIPWITPGERPPLIVLDGAVVADSLVEARLKAIPIDGVASIEVLRGEAAVARYGPKAKDGAFLITTKGATTPAAATPATTKPAPR